MQRFIYGLILSILPLVGTSAQHTSHSEPDTISRFKDFFTKGHLEGHVRNFFMTTINDGALTDYYANAIGGIMRYDSPEFYGFHVGAAGIFTYKVFASDLNAPDPTTGEISKWEHELFDILDFDNFNDLDRLEELYIQYRFKHGFATYGKLEIEDTPLLNPSDGRMKPFAFKGVWVHLKPGHEQDLHLAWLDRISPRSTVEWFDFKEGIGLLNNGFQPDGSEADYHEHLESRGVALLGYGRHWERLKIQAYQWYVHHLGYTSWLELGYRQGEWALGLQYALQFPDTFQEELGYEQRYVQPEENGQVLSGEVAWQPGPWTFKAAYTHAFDSGRFLFPRELGRDQFFTSIPRSRLEGFGNAEVLTFSGAYQFHPEGLSAALAYTELFGPETGDFEFNKYNLDAYRQWNARLDYQFHGYLDGLGIQLLYIYKQNKADTSPEIIFNRSNYHQLSLVTNFTF